jgi:hypothetical protein
LTTRVSTLNMTQKNSLSFAIALAAFGLLFWQCTKPTPFGAELLDDQIADFFGDSLDLTCTYERASDTTITADRTSSFDYFLLGQLKDPKLGTTTVDLYSSFRRFASDTVDISAFKYDSAQLVMSFNTLGFYGDTFSTQNVVVHELAEVLDFNKGYKAGDVLPVADEIGRLENLQPKPRTRTKFLDTSANALRLAHIKIPLTEAFGKKLLEIPVAQSKVPTELQKIFKGIKIESRPVGSGAGAIMGLNINSSATSFIRLYYHVNDTVQDYTDFVMSVGGTDQQVSKFMHIEHDYSGTNVETNLNQPNPAELYLQGMGGLRLKVELPATNVLNDVLINKAELQFFAEQSKEYPASSQISALRINSSDKLSITSDLAYSLEVADGFVLFGGNPRTTSNTNLVKYQMTFTDYLQGIVKDIQTDPKKRVLYLDFLNSDNGILLTPTRTVIFGPTHPQYPMKLRLKYTKL